MLGISIGLNAVSSHGACTAVFVAVAAIIGFMFASIRTLGRISWLAWIGLICILTASEFNLPHQTALASKRSVLMTVVLTVTIAVGIQDRPAKAPQEGPWTPDFHLFKSPSFTSGISAISTLIFAYAGTPAFFAIAAEMREPRHYNRSLMVCQAGVTITYIVIGTVVYYFCGSYVSSPALGSAGAQVKKVAYGLALPGLIVTTTLVVHVSTPVAV
jgi:amino acid transporter